MVRKDRRVPARGLSRRTLLLGSAAAAAMTSGCGVTAGQQQSGPTRTIETHLGPARIPADPRRVVCLDQYSTLALLDVGVRPAATIEGLDDWMPTTQLPVYRELPKVGGYAADLERIVAIEPDLIIGNSAFTLSGGNTYERFNKIAATVILTSVVSGQWQQMATQVANAVNRSAQMDELRNRYLQRAKAIRERYSPLLRDNRFSLVASFENGQWNLCLPDSWSGVVLAEAGCRFGAASEAKTGSAVRQSLEQLGILGDSQVILYQANPDGQLGAPIRALLDQPNFGNLPAVKEGRSVPMRNFYVFGYAQALGALDELEAVLLRLSR